MRLPSQIVGLSRTSSRDRPPTTTACCGPPMNCIEIVACPPGFGTLQFCVNNEPIVFCVPPIGGSGGINYQIDPIFGASTRPIF